jgi:hypothetical protein
MIHKLLRRKDSQSMFIAIKPHPTAMIKAMGVPLRVLKNMQPSLLKVAALYFDKLAILDPVRRDLRDYRCESLLLRSR